MLLPRSTRPLDNLNFNFRPHIAAVAITRGPFGNGASIRSSQTIPNSLPYAKANPGKVRHGVSRQRKSNPSAGEFGSR